jgi:hypothetical protein
MNPQEAYGAALRRLDTRESHRELFYASLMLLAVLILLSLGNNFTPYCAVPLTALVGLITVAQGIRLYFESPRALPSREGLDQEMYWLYGPDWKSTTSVEESEFALDRIRKRRIGRWMFLLYLPVFLPIIGLILLLAPLFTQYDPAASPLLYGLPILYLIFLLWKVWQAFPTADRLARRERKAGEALDLELEVLHLDKQKRGEKAKRHSRLVLSDDGELVEVPEPVDEQSDNASSSLTG